MAGPIPAIIAASTKIPGVKRAIKKYGKAAVKNALEQIQGGSKKSLPKQVEDIVRVAEKETKGGFEKGMRPPTVKREGDIHKPSPTHSTGRKGYKKLSGISHRDKRYGQVLGKTHQALKKVVTAEPIPSKVKIRKKEDKEKGEARLNLDRSLKKSKDPTDSPELRERKKAPRSKPKPKPKPKPKKYSDTGQRPDSRKLDDYEYFKDKARGSAQNWNVKIKRNKKGGLVGVGTALKGYGKVRAL